MARRAVGSRHPQPRVDDNGRELGVGGPELAPGVVRAGMSMAQSWAVVAEFAAIGAPGAGHDIANLAANVVFAHGSDDTKRRFLYGALIGDVHFCLLYSEPGAGSDLAGIQCRAERDGDEWVVNGQKVWTSGGHTAEYGLLLARTDWDVPKHQGCELLRVPDAPTRCRGPPDQDDHRRVALQRGVPRRCPHPQR